MIFLLDSSALVAHALGLSGAKEVQALIDNDENDILLSALSLFELAGVLKRWGLDHHVPEYWQIYGEGLEVLPVDSDLVKSAWNLRESILHRLPMADAIIAATAHSRGATLVHRDQHLAAIPVTMISQLRLPGV